MTHLLSTLTDHPASWVALRVILTSFFWMAGLFGVFNFNVIVQEMREVKLPAPAAFAVATIATQLVGSAFYFELQGFGLAWCGCSGGLHAAHNPARACVLDL